MSVMKIISFGTSVPFRASIMAGNFTRTLLKKESRRYDFFHFVLIRSWIASFVRSSSNALVILFERSIGSIVPDSESADCVPVEGGTRPGAGPVVGGCCGRVGGLVTTLAPR